MISVKRVFADHSGDPVGSVRIQNPAGDILVVEDTMIDAWFDTLLEAIAKLSTGESAVVLDLVDEPWPLHMYIDGGYVHVRYRDDDLLLAPLEQVRREVVRDIEAVLPEVERGTETPPLIVDIKKKLVMLGR